MLPSLQTTDLLGLGFLLIGLVVAGIAVAGKAKDLTEDTGEYLAGGALLVAILGLIFVFTE